MDKYDVTGRPVQFGTYRFKSRQQFKHSWDPQNRVSSNDEPCSCPCLTTLNTRKQATRKHLSKTQKRLPNMQSNSSEVFGVSDLDKKECGTVRARTHQPENGISEDRQGHSRDDVEEGCVRKPNIREETTFHDDVYDAPRQTNKHSTSWRSDVPPPLSGWSITPVGLRQHLRYTRADSGQEAVGGSTSTSTRTRHRSQTQVLNTGGVHKPGRGEKVRGTEALVKLHHNLS